MGDEQVAAALDSIATAIKKQKCILFIGAGVHAPPPQGSGYAVDAESQPPFGSGLSERLAEGCDLKRRFPNEDVKNLQRVSAFFEIQHKRHALVEAIKQALGVAKRPSPMLKALAQLDFPLVITTNYDQQFEKALAGADKYPKVSVYTPNNLEPTVDFGDPEAESPTLFKIHGDIARPETLVVTDEDYIQFVLRMSRKEPYDPLPMTLKYHLARWPTLFVGYSLLDYNLRLLFKTLRWSIDHANLPDMYSVDFKPDPLILDVWDNQRRDVTIIAEDVWAFVPELYELVRGEKLAP